MFSRKGPHGPVPYRSVTFADTETTGLLPYGVGDTGQPSQDPHGPDRLCSLGAVRVERVPGGWRVGLSCEWLCDPGRPVQPAAAAVNRFHWSDDDDSGNVPEGFHTLRGLMAAEQALRGLDSFRADGPLGFHNETFDVAVLDAERDRAGVARCTMPVVCTKKAFSEIQGLGRPDHYVRGTNLNALCDLLGICRAARIDGAGGERHGALDDAVLAAQCFCVLEPLGWIKVDDPADLPHRSLPLLRTA